MKLVFESYEYNRDFGSFSISVKEREEKRLPKIVELICDIEGIEGISSDEYLADFTFCKSTYSEDCIRKLWKSVKNDV